MADFIQDLRYAWRGPRKSPGFAMVAVLSLALGIGANTAIFTLINQVLLELLPVKHPEELVLLTSRGPHYGSNTGSNAISYPMYRDIRDRNQVFSGMFCRHSLPLSLTFEGKTERIAGELVSGNYFPVLGVGAALGRTFTASDDLTQGGHPLALLSYGFWKTRFGMDPNVIGKRIVVNGYPLTIVGVSQKGFDGVEPGFSPQIRIPMMMKHEMTPGPWYSLNNRRGRFTQAFGRLKPGITLERAKAGLQPLFHEILAMEVQQKEFAKASPYTRQQFLKMWMDVLPAAKGRSQLRQQFQKPLLALMAIVALVLLIACSNVANLLIARATARQKEIAVRLALGAGRARLIRQLLVESTLLSLAGGLLGLALAVGMNQVLIGFVPHENTPLTISGTPDWRVLQFTLAVSVLTGILFGLVPALQSTRPDLAATLKDQAGSVVGGAAVRLRKALVTAQVALSLLLLIGAGLFLRSLRNLQEIDPGFRTQTLLSLRADPTLNGYKPERSLQFYRQLTERTRAVPGVEAAALAVIPVLSDDEWDSTITVEGYTAKPGESMNPHMQFVSPGFFETLGIPMPLGRDFTDRDVKDAPLVAIVNEKFVKRYFGDAYPIGHGIGMGGDPGTKTDITIIGVVRDTKYENLRAEIPFQVYRPYQQVSFVTGMTAYLRARGGPSNLFPTLRRAVREVDANVPVSHMRTLKEQVDVSLVRERLLATLSSAFGLLASLLAAVGLYGVMGYMVARRTREIGIRMALGASSRSVIRLVMREVLLLVGAGVGIGLPAAWALTRLVETQLYAVAPSDPWSVGLATAGIAATALLAAYFPARRAMQVDPMRALRWE